MAIDDGHQEADPARVRRLADDLGGPLGRQLERARRRRRGEPLDRCRLGRRSGDGQALLGLVAGRIGHQMQPVGVRGGIRPGWPSATGSGPSVILPVLMVSTPAPSTEIEKRSMPRGAGPNCGAVRLDPEPVVARPVARALQPEVLQARVRLAAEVRAALVERADVERRAVAGRVLAGQEALLAGVDQDDERAGLGVVGREALVDRQRRVLELDRLEVADRDRGAEAALEVRPGERDGARQ